MCRVLLEAVDHSSGNPSGSTSVSVSRIAKTTTRSPRPGGTQQVRASRPRPGRATEHRRSDRRAAALRQSPRAGSGPPAPRGTDRAPVRRGCRTPFPARLVGLRQHREAIQHGGAELVSAANASSISNCRPATRTTRHPDAASRRYSSSAVLPTPASPRITRARLSPMRTASTRSSRTWHSAARPSSTPPVPTVHPGARTLFGVDAATARARHRPFHSHPSNGASCAHGRSATGVSQPISCRPRRRSPVPGHHATCEPVMRLGSSAVNA